jgi:hypothetical protein
MTTYSADINWIMSPQAVREQSKRIFSMMEEGKTSFEYHPEKWNDVLAHVKATILKNYPDLNIPEHGRTVHLKANGHDRPQWILDACGDLDSWEEGKLLFDFIVVSVLLDAGAGDQWKYQEERTGETYSRSEGLGVASVHMLLDGGFSHNNDIRVTAEGLLNLSETELEKHFQVKSENPLLGVKGRTELLNNLGKTLKDKSNIFPNGRVSDLMDNWKELGQVKGEQLLSGLLFGLGAIWPGRLQREGVNLGDVWHYSGFGNADDIKSLQPFHKLSQWLAYSLLAPLRHAGLKVTDLSSLTGLPEYRNGGLFVDSGLLSLRDSGQKEREHEPSSDLIIEWRALTIVLLDELGRKLPEYMNVDLSLPQVLEGGSWWAGRLLARELRPGGGPPLRLKSDGTVF